MSYTSSVSGEVDPLYAQKNLQKERSRLQRHIATVAQLKKFTDGDRNPVLSQFNSLKEKTSAVSAALDKIG